MGDLMQECQDHQQDAKKWKQRVDELVKEKEEALARRSGAFLPFVSLPFLPFPGS
jgi:hypothetical protein